MTEQEKINHETHTKLALTDAKFNMFVEEMRDFKQEIRKQNENLDKKLAAINASTDERVLKIQESINATNRHLQNFLIAGMIGVGAIAVTAIGAIAAIVWK